MQNPFFIKASIPTSGKTPKSGTIPLIRARTLSLTGRVTYNASATAKCKVNVYYSLDGKNWDTVPYTSFDLTLTAGEEVQRTINVDPQEHGFIAVEIENTDATYTATNAKMWYSIQSWLPEPMLERGNITKDQGEENN